ncbi:MAG: hypothetical protein KDC98_10435, partial [Planctomycetes bacterium]|nr:hypothetical protein [Planctomycetota bacterium]
MASTLEFPAAPEAMAHVPFRDAAGVALAARLRRFGTLDLDGNRIADAFWLGDATGAHELQLAMGREHSPGRFRDWPVPHGLATGIADAAVLRQSWAEQDSLLLADPTAQHLQLLSFNLATAGNPHLGGWFTTAPYLAIPAMI